MVDCKNWALGFEPLDCGGCDEVQTALKALQVLCCGRQAARLLHGGQLCRHPLCGVCATLCGCPECQKTVGLM